MRPEGALVDVVFVDAMFFSLAAHFMQNMRMWPALSDFDRLDALLEFADAGAVGSFTWPTASGADATASLVSSSGPW